MRLLILQDGIYNDEDNRAQARRAGEYHTTLPDYGRTLIASGLAMALSTTGKPEELLAAQIPDQTDVTAATIDLRDGVSDSEARLAGRALKQRRKRK